MVCDIERHGERLQGLVEILEKPGYSSSSADIGYQLQTATDFEAEVERSSERMAEIASMSASGKVSQLSERLQSEYNGLEEKRRQDEDTMLNHYDAAIVATRRKDGPEAVVKLIRQSPYGPDNAMAVALYYLRVGKIPMEIESQSAPGRRAA